MNDRIKKDTWCSCDVCGNLVENGVMFEPFFQQKTNFSLSIQTMFICLDCIQTMRELVELPEKKEL